MAIKKKVAALIKLREKLNKKYGAGTVEAFTAVKNKDIKGTPCGLPLLDDLIGCGGFPEGLFIELWGPERAGKTLLAMTAVASYQSQGKRCAFVDVEGTYSKRFSEIIGVNHDELEYVQPDSAEDALEIMREFAESGLFDLVILDSIAALVPQSEIEGEIGDAEMAKRARLMSKACRVLSPIFRKNKCDALWINQVRENIGGYGNSEVQPGGKGMKFAAAIRLGIRRKETLKKGSTILGHNCGITIYKNKVGDTVGESIDVNLIYGKGFDPIGQLAQLAVKKGVIVRAGSWFSYGDTKIGQGIETVVSALEEEGFYEEVYGRVFSAGTAKETTSAPEELPLPKTTDKIEDNDK